MKGELTIKILKIRLIKMKIFKKTINLIQHQSYLIHSLD